MQGGHNNGMTITASDHIGNHIGDQCYPRLGSATLYTVRS